MIGRDSAESVLARKYAPVYWFAEDERYFPTLPFFTAFDGIDNPLSPDSLIDYLDLLEVAPGEEKRAVWNGLDVAYTARRDLVLGKEPVFPSAVFFNVDTLDSGEAKELWRYLRSDEQTWHRYDRDSLVLSPAERDTTRFFVFEYYAYYLNDRGLVGHPRDMELVFVFAPEDTSLDFLMIVGAGHTPAVPNNVLVLTGEKARQYKNERPNILVEFGDHSSAPDLPPLGEFNPGIDANWHVQNLWGTRDVQAASGMGALGEYQMWMGFFRDSSQVVRLFPRTHWEELPESRKPSRHLERDYYYALLPARTFRCLYDTLRNIKDERPDDPTESDVRDVVDVMASLAEWTDHDRTGWHLKEFAEWLGTAPYHQGRRSVVERMTLWVEDMVMYLPPGRAVELSYPGDRRPARMRVLEVESREENVKAKHHQPWEHSLYDPPPTDILKHHLFRPAMDALSPTELYRVLQIWGTYYVNDAGMVQIGAVVPAWHFPIRLPGYLEFAGGVYFSFPETSSAWSMAYTLDYSQLFTFYFHLLFVPARQRVEADESVSDVSLTSGISILPLLVASQSGSPVVRTLFSRATIRLGLRTDLSDEGPRLNLGEWELQIGIF